MAKKGPHRGNSTLDGVSQELVELLLFLPLGDLLLRCQHQNLSVLFRVRIVGVARVQGTHSREGGRLVSAWDLFLQLPHGIIKSSLKHGLLVRVLQAPHIVFRGGGRCRGHGRDLLSLDHPLQRAGLLGNQSPLGSPHPHSLLHRAQCLHELVWPNDVVNLETFPGLSGYKKARENSLQMQHSGGGGQAKVLREGSAQILTILIQIGSLVDVEEL